MTKSLLLVFVLLLLFKVDKAVSQNQEIYVTKVKNQDNSVDFNYIKNAVGSYFLKVELENVENVEGSASLSAIHNFNLTADSGTLFKLFPADNRTEIFCSYNYSYQKGTIQPKVDEAITYVLPFKKNKKVTIYESGRFNIKTDIWKNYLAYSKTKDTIYGMRKGTVVDIVKFAANTTDQTATTVYRTKIIVEHADGTNASYIGLDPTLLFVKLNQTIYPQSPIGVMDDVINYEKNRDFKFNIFYFSNEELTDLKGKKYKVIEKSVMPNFLTKEGKQKLITDQDYIATCNDDVVFQEMTNEEKQVHINSSNLN